MMRLSGDNPAQDRGPANDIDGAGARELAKTEETLHKWMYVGQRYGLPQVPRDMLAV